MKRTAPPACFTPRQKDAVFVYPAQLPSGKSIKLLKTLLTSACERDCYYCPFRAGRDFRRETFRPDEFASVFMQLNQRGLAEGIFLSSGIAGGGLRTEDKLLATAEILRKKQHYRGYLHLKLMPGVERAQVEMAMRLADRVSVNLEAPNTQRLARLAPHKQFVDELIAPLRWVEDIRRTQPSHLGWNGRWPSTTTQFVVGAADETDVEILKTTTWLNQHVGLQRAYYSAFSPVRNTPLENKAPTNPLREQRLYQASFLLRDYGFAMEEMPFTDDGHLPLTQDPKRAWAEQHLREHPIDLNRADRQALLRIPGIGPRGAQAVLNARRVHRLEHIMQVKKLGIEVARAEPFILLNGKRPGYQLTFAGWTP
ncbi:MAG TPA: radical SAM protein [Anaerolineales bacterium]